MLHAQPLLHEPEPDQEHNPNAVFELEQEEPATREDRQQKTSEAHQQLHQQYDSDCDSNEQPDGAAGSHDEQVHEHMLRGNEDMQSRTRAAMHHHRALHKITEMISTHCAVTLCEALTPQQHSALFG